MNQKTDKPQEPKSAEALQNGRNRGVLTVLMILVVLLFCLGLSKFMTGV